MAKKRKVSNPIEEEMNELIPKKENPFDKIKLNFKCKNKKQKECVKLIKEKHIIFIESPAGVGKTAVSVATAVDLIKDKDTPYEKIILVISPVQTDIEVAQKDLERYKNLYAKGAVSKQTLDNAHSLPVEHSLHHAHS